jgi:type II restriction/modification system DNA methylase subunit YeeA
VRYLVENSLGRLWMLNRPNSRLVEQMDYYIKPAPAADGSDQPETDFLRINKPEEIKICDPACGSGHMLTYAFDLLYAIYEEDGYEPADIPAMILTHNLYGVEIDERAGELAAFALTMKARAKQRRFFRNPIQPHICVLENVHFDEGELNEYMDVIGRDLFTSELRETLGQFEQAKNFGSLIVPKLRDPAETLRLVEARDFAGDLLLNDVHARVVAVLHMAEVLSPKYHVVVANPPYMGSSGYNVELKKWCSKNGYKTTRSDMYAAFIQRSISMTSQSGLAALVTRQDWAFTKSYEYIRDFILEQSDIELLSLLGKGVFETLTGEVVQPVAFVMRKGRTNDHLGLFCNATEAEGAKKQEIVQNPDKYVSVSERIFKNIPLKAFIFWKTPKFLEMFVGREKVGDRVSCREGIHTGSNDRYLRAWWEISSGDFVRNASSYSDLDASGHYAPYNKGGSTDKWYGGNETCISFSSRFREEMKKLSGHVRPSESLYFKEGGTWADVATKGMGVRFYPKGFLFDGAGPVVVGEDVKTLIANMNSKPFYEACAAVMPNLHFKSGTIKLMPVADLDPAITVSVSSLAESCILFTKSDWNAYETSWDFTALPLLHPDYRAKTLEGIFANLRTHWQDMTDQVQRLEEENNSIFIDAYGLQDELSPEVPLEEITLTCNPAYRYGAKTSNVDREIRLRVDTVIEFLSYAVGCMFGRYALDKPGLILANQGETIEDYLKQIPEPRFPADNDNVIPMLDGDWFSDDISERFREFLRITFGEEHYDENLRFIEQALGKDIRKYFLKDFYNDHVRRYKKRPIYWLFSSPKGSFNALIYMHRYRPDTVSVVLNDYLREFRTKLTSRRDHLEAVSISASASSGEKTKAIKDIEKISKIIVELADYERDVLYPLATRQVEIDLDDGVKVNYPKFGDALKKITGLS